jgi:hypothetical protein
MGRKLQWSTSWRSTSAHLSLTTQRAMTRLVEVEDRVTYHLVDGPAEELAVQIAPLAAELGDRKIVIGSGLAFCLAAL